jgi:hypothetical protein
MPKIRMHKHVCQKLEWLEITALDIIKRKPFVERLEQKFADNEQNYVQQKKILNDRSDVSEHAIFQKRSECCLSLILQMFCFRRVHNLDFDKQKADPPRFPFLEN